jgi:YegS/Rv2252/BmrU family lipid kinase
MKPRAVVIINPISGAGRRRDLARRRAEQAAALAEAHEIDAEIIVTERQGHARELAEAARQRGVTLFLAWGGDGTVNEVASAIVHSDASLAIVPSGSGNGLARELDIPFDPAAAFRIAFEGRARVIDAGELDGRWFFNLAGIGLDARVAHRFAEGGLQRRGFARYLELTARELFTFDPPALTIQAEGATTSTRPLLVALANARQYGNGALIAPQARLDDGKLDLVIVDYRSPWAVLRQIRRLFSGELARVPGVSMTQTAAVEIACAAPFEYHVDGEPHVGGLCINACARPAVLRVQTARE